MYKVFSSVWWFHFGFSFRFTLYLLYMLSSLLGLMKDLKTVLLKGIASSKVLLKKTSLRSGKILIINFNYFTSINRFNLYVFICRPDPERYSFNLGRNINVRDILICFSGNSYFSISGFLQKFLRDLCSRYKEINWRNWAGNFRMVDIEINAWSSLFLDLETKLILYLYPEKCMKFNQSKSRIRSR